MKQNTLLNTKLDTLSYVNLSPNLANYLTYGIQKSI